MLGVEDIDADDPGLDRILEAGARAGVPINLLCSGKTAVMRELARRHPNTQLIMDHVGLKQPFSPPAPPEPWADLEDVASLAQFDNVAIKISGSCTLSHEPFPYADIWAPLSRLFEAFGFDRCMWGTDWTPGGESADLRAGRRGVPGDRGTLRYGAGGADGGGRCRRSTSGRRGRESARA